MVDSMILGIDPGLRGAFAWLCPNGKVVRTALMPVNDNRLDLKDLCFFFTHDKIDRLYIEDISPRPGQGVQSIRTSAQNFGILLGMAGAYQIETRIIPASVWVPHMHAEPNFYPCCEDDPKLRSRALAQKLFPNEKLNLGKFNRPPHDGIVDALLIAEYGRRREHVLEESA